MTRVIPAALRGFREPLVGWYQKNARDLPWRQDADGYRVWISEIMLQQTRVEAVKPYYERFLQALPDVAALCAVPDETLMKLWEGLGYYSRARNLKRAAQQVMEEFNGAIPRTYEALLTLPGIGEYTAGAIASIAFSQPVPAVDGNVLRVLARYCDDDTDIALPKAKKAARDALSPWMPEEQPGEFNQAIMELGALVCLPNGQPQCESCPVGVRNGCRGFAGGRAALLPVKAKKAPRRQEEMTVFVLRTSEGIALLPRPESGLLSGLWELPHVPGVLNATQAAAKLKDFGVRLTGSIIARERKHVFTHIEWRMQVYDCEVEFLRAQPPGWRVDWPDGDGPALPTAFRVCLE